MISAVAATAIPSSSRKATPRRPVGTPPARATGASSDAKNSGRPTIANTASTATATQSSVTTWPWVMPRKVPKRSASSPANWPP